MNRKLKVSSVFVVATIGITMFVGCVEEEKAPEAAYPTLTSTPIQFTTPNVEVIVISGVDKITEINYDKPVKLVISGVRNMITVSEETVLTEIVLTGVDNTVYIPSSSTPKITDSGVDNEIIRY